MWTGVAGVALSDGDAASWGLLPGYLSEPKYLCYCPIGNAGVRNSASSGPFISFRLLFLFTCHFPFKPLAFLLSVSDGMR